jgi:hypothetical protein
MESGKIVLTHSQVSIICISYVKFMDAVLFILFYFFGGDNTGKRRKLLVMIFMLRNFPTFHSQIFLNKKMKRDGMPEHRREIILIFHLYAHISYLFLLFKYERSK